MNLTKETKTTLLTQLDKVAKIGGEGVYDFFLRYALYIRDDRKIRDDFKQEFEKILNNIKENKHGKE